MPSPNLNQNPSPTSFRLSYVWESGEIEYAVTRGRQRLEGSFLVREVADLALREIRKIAAKRMN